MEAKVNHLRNRINLNTIATFIYYRKQNVLSDMSDNTFCSLASESGDRLFLLFSLRSFEKNIIFACLYAMLKLCLYRVSKKKFPLHTVIGFANSAVCY